MSGSSTAPRNHLGEILAPEHTDEHAVGVRDHDSGELLVAHPLRDRLDSRARPDRARPEGHGVFGPNGLARLQRPSAEETKDYALVVRDDADLPLVPLACGDGGDDLVGPARRRIRTREASDAGAAVRLALERKPERAQSALPAT
jgi:hypothetical protein